jgi:PAS domain S-box-containing protein
MITLIPIDWDTDRERCAFLCGGWMLEPSRRQTNSGRFRMPGRVDDERFQRLLEHLPVGVYRTTLDGRIIEGNQALLAILGLRSESQLRNLNVKQFYVNEQDRNQHLEQLSLDLTYFSEFQFRTHDNRIIWVRDYPRVILDEEGLVKYYDGIIIDITQMKTIEIERENLIRDLKQAIENIQTLSGLLPICASCKKIRDDKGYWEAVEEYLLKHAKIRFSHGICPDCRDVLYPELVRKHGHGRE